MLYLFTFIYVYFVNIMVVCAYVLSVSRLIDYNYSTTCRKVYRMNFYKVDVHL